MVNARLRNAFRKAVETAVGDQGQPATLGTAGGTIFYDDGTTVHKNRVWVRMGADHQNLVVAKAERQGLPAVAGLAVTVVERHGMLYVVDWDRDEGLSHTHDFDTRNVVVGTTSNTAGSDNTVMGNQAGNSLASGAARNTAIGRSAGRFLDTGDDNVFVGFEAGTTASGNTLSRNVVIGANAGENLDGANNVLIGYLAGDDITDDYNIAIGYQAGAGQTTGTENIFIGRQAGSVDHFANQTTGSIMIGYRAGLSISGDNLLVIENGASSAALVYGEFDNNNLGFLGAAAASAMGGGSGVMALRNADTVPASNYANGGILYVESGALKWRGSGGTITTLGAA